ncbi:MAG: ABC transporter permease subunit [Euryarchaeota archaeon]|nr:ABC transporter permease subunit [Euryarchaeota archaeon]
MPRAAGPMRSAARLRRVATIAKGELGRTRKQLDRKTLLGLLLFGVLGALLSPFVLGAGFDFDHDIYRAAVTADSPLRPALEADPVFRVFIVDDPAPFVDADEADLGVDRMNAFAKPTDKGKASLVALDDAVKAHTHLIMRSEPDQTAAFPVRITLSYEEQAPGAFGGGTSGALPEPIDPRAGETADEEESRLEGEGGDGTDTPSGDASAPPPSGDIDGGFSYMPQGDEPNTPGTLQPPFPFRSLLLAYAFLLPMNFIVQVYAGAILRERLGRQGEALLASPVTPMEILIGKTLPYLVLMLGISAAIALWIGAGWVSLVAVVPLVLVFLALEFIAAMFARSFRELTFLTVFASVLLTMYAFLPAAFTEVHPVALVSPISLIVLDLRGSEISLIEMLYATVPLTLVAMVLFLLGVALFREEDLFHQKPVLSKAVDAVARQVHGLGSGFWLAALFIPFVLVAELFLVAFLFAWPVQTGVLGTLVAIAFVEELFKGAPSYAAAQRGRVPMKRMLLFGALVGVGFFVAEKAFLFASLTGLFQVPAGAAVFGSAGAGALDAGIPWLVVGVLLLFPLLLHVVTACISAWGARRGRADFVVAFTSAVLLHAAYNLAILKVLGGGGLL